METDSYRSSQLSAYRTPLLTTRSSCMQYGHTQQRSPALSTYSPHGAVQTAIVQSWRGLRRLLLPTVFAAAPLVNMESTPGTQEEMSSAQEISAVTVTNAENNKHTTLESTPQIVISDAEIKDYISNETGRDRLRAMFYADDKGKPSPELQMVADTVTSSSLIFFMLMSVVGGSLAKEKFLMKNTHTVFDTKFIATRRYNDTVLFGSLRFGLKWALKAAMFTGVLTLTSQSISVYRNKTSVLEYVVGGAVTCGLLRFGVGPRGMFAGSVIGAGLGLVGGVCFYTLLRASGETQELRHYHQVELLLRERRQLEIWFPSVANNRTFSQSSTNQTAVS